MGQSPYFSVVIPTYNRGRTLPGTVDSVLSQTFHDLEVVIVDDGSEDNTREVVERIRDPRVRYIRQVNGGASKARNAGIDNSRGQYICFLDSDDYFLPYHLENAKRALGERGDICIYTQIIVDRGNGVRYLKPHRALRNGEHIADYLLRDRGFVPTISLVVPKSLAQRVRYDELLRAGDDYDFAIRLVHVGAELRMLPEPGAIWNDRSSADRLSSKSDPDNRIAWLQRIRPQITSQAYWAEIGWPVAKGYSQRGQRLRALWLYLNAIGRMCYRPKMAIVVGLQVLLPPHAYRKLSDTLAKFGVKP